MWRVKYVTVNVFLSYEEQTEFEVQHIYEILGVFKKKNKKKENKGEEKMKKKIEKKRDGTVTVT